jgi:hypothetical protein
MEVRVNFAPFKPRVRGCLHVCFSAQIGEQFDVRFAARVIPQVNFGFVLLKCVDRPL